MFFVRLFALLLLLIPTCAYSQGAIINPQTNASNLITGTLPAARIAGSYTGLTGTGTLTAGATGAGFTVALGTSTLTGILPAANGGAGTINGALTANGSGTVTQAACANLSNGATGCSTATGTSGATIPLLNGTNTWSGVNAHSAAINYSAASGANFITGTATTGTNAVYFKLNNTGGGYYFGADNSAGNAITSGGVAYGLTFNSDTTGRAITFGVGGTARMYIGKTTDNTISFGTTLYASCTALTTNAGADVSCTASSLRFKNPLGTVVDTSNLLNLKASVFTYKDTKTFDDREHIGLYAEDVCALDERLCVRDGDGAVKNYEERGVLALLLETVKQQQAEIDTLKKAIR